MGQGSRILIVTRGLDPVGTGRQVELAAEGLAANGFDVSVAVTSRGGDLSRRLAARGMTVHAVGQRPVPDAASAVRLARLATQIRPDVMLGFGRSAAWPLLIAKRCHGGCRAVLWLGLQPRRRWGLAAASRLDRVLAASPGVAAACSRAGMRPGMVDVVQPGIAAGTVQGLSRQAIADRLGLDPSKTWTLSVAPLEPEPRLQRLLWAIDQLGVVRKDLQHVLIGSGPLLTGLWRRSRAQELAERLFVFPTCAVVRDLLAHVRLVWQSGDVALGGALLDASACGLPTVAVDSDAARQLIADGVTGRIVLPVPESELPRRAFNILEDEGLARRFGEAAAIRAAEEFPGDRFVAGLISAISRRP